LSCDRKTLSSGIGHSRPRPVGCGASRGNSRAVDHSRADRREHRTKKYTAMKISTASPVPRIVSRLGLALVRCCQRTIHAATWTTTRRNLVSAFFRTSSLAPHFYFIPLQVNNTTQSRCSSAAPAPAPAPAPALAPAPAPDPARTATQQNAKEDCFGPSLISLGQHPCRPIAEGRRRLDVRQVVLTGRCVEEATAKSIWLQ